MRKYLLLIAIVLGVMSCSTQNSQNSTAVTDKDAVRISNGKNDKDESEYQVIITDPRFQTWLDTRAKPRGYYGLSYLENKNRQWTMEWNMRAMNPRYAGLYPMTIDYQPSIDYGYEANYILYNYYVYFQNTNRQRLGGSVPMF